MSSKGEGAKCGLVVEIKYNVLRWFGHVERMAGTEITERAYMSMVGAAGARE